MPVEAILIAGPAIDFNTLLSVAHQALGRNLAEAADASHRKMADAEKFLTCIAALRGEDHAITPDLLGHVSFTILVIADGRDMLAILEMTSGMAFVRTQTTARDVDMAVVTGTLSQWKNAVVSGTDEVASPIVRTCYSKILLLFDRAGLTSVWNDYDRSTAPHRNGLLLEDNRK